MKKLWNPYAAGVALGLVLLGAFLVMGHGLGASGAAARIGAVGLEAVAPDHVRKDDSYFSRYFQGDSKPLNVWIIFMAVGVFIGGAVSSMFGGRAKSEVVRGPGISVRNRLLMALAGGVLMGIAARVARGCTSGQALSGGALLSVGSWIFMMAVFGGGYALAYFVRRQWL